MSCLSECPNQLGDEFSNGTANTLEEVLIQGNVTGNKDIVISAGQKLNASGAGSQVLARTAYVESIAPLTFPIGSQIGVLGGLTFPGDMNLRNNAQSGGTAVTIDSIPVAPTTQANVVSYNPTTKNLYYQAAGGGGSVTSVSAGTNISVTGTASAPIVNLRAPLTSQLDVGDQIITRSTPGTLEIQNTPSSINLTALQIGLTTTGNTFISGSGPSSRLAVNMSGNQRLEVNSDGVTVTPTTSGSGGNLSVTRSGNLPNPLLVLQNNSGTNATVKMDMVMSRNSPSVPVAGDVIGQITTRGDNYLGTVVDYTQIESVIQNIGSAGAPTNIDGTLNLKCITNSVYNTYISLNGSSQQINMGKDVLMGGNSIINITNIGLIAGAGGYGLTGQSLVSTGGSVGNRWNYNMAGASIVSTGGSSGINSGSFSDILGGLAIPLTTSGFVVSPINRYRISINGTFSGVNDTVRMYMEIQQNGIGTIATGEIFNIGSNLYYYANQVSGFDGTHYTTYSFSDLFVLNLQQSNNCTVNLWVESSSGSHTINNNRHAVCIEPLYN
jgi:hypothetical protein